MRQRVLSTNWLPSGSRKIANPPQCDFSGGLTNSTPRSESWRWVASRASQARAPLKKLPTRSSCPSGVNRTKRVGLLPMASSIQRCLSLKGWSDINVKPTCSVQKARARSWSVVGIETNLTWVIMRPSYCWLHCPAQGAGDKEFDKHYSARHDTGSAPRPLCQRCADARPGRSRPQALGVSCLFLAVADEPGRGTR